MAKLDPAIRHAITPVAFDETKLRRERLVDAIHAEIERKLLVIAAPAGYGKTTLLADLCAHSDLEFCWIRLNHGHRQLVSLGETVIHALETRFRRIRGILKPSRFVATPPVGLAAAISDVIWSKIPEPFLLIFDDIEQIAGSEECTEFLDELIDKTPEHAKFIFSGREVLEVSLARLMANGDLAAIGPHELALTNSEAVELGSLLASDEGHRIDVAKLNADMQGWVTGLVLALKAGTIDLGTGLSGTQDILHNYFASTILNRIGDDLRQFMLQSSLLPTLSSESADYVLGRSDSSSLIRQLYDSRAFIHQTSTGREEYEYHPLFRDFLRETYKVANPSDYRAITKRAAKYFDDYGSPDWAVSSYISIGALEEACEVGNRAAPEIYARGRFDLLLKWVEDLSVLGPKVNDLRLWAASGCLEVGRNDQVLELLRDLTEQLHGSEREVRQSFRAYLLRANAYLRLGEREVLQELLTKLNEVSPMLSEASEDSSLLSRFFRLLAEVERQSPTGSLETSKDFAERALEAAKRSQESLQIGHSYHLLSVLQSLAGNLPEASATGKKAIQILRANGNPASVAGVMNDQAIRDFLQGDYEGSISLLREALLEARVAANADIEATVLISQAEIFNDLGLPVQAAELFDQGLQLAVEISDNYLILEACIGSAILHRRNGTLSVASRWLERANELRSGQLGSEPPSLALEKAALQIAVSPSISLSICNELIESSPGLDAYMSTKARLLRFYASCRMESERRSPDWLRECLDYASTTGATQMIAAECLHDRVLRDYLLAQNSRDHPGLEIVKDRIEQMTSLRTRWEFESQRRRTPNENRLRVFTMGGSSVRAGSRLSVESLKPQAMEVLYYLVDKRIGQKHAMTSAFWPDHSEGRQAANLHMAIYSIRQALGKDAIELEGVAYKLNDDLIEYYDVAEFERSARVAEQVPEGDPRRLFALTDAISRYKGSYLLEHASSWVVDRRRSVDQRYLDLVASYADEVLIRNDPGKAIQSMRRALEIDPYRDDLNLRYLRILSRLGRRSEIVSHFDHYRRLIQSDLGLDPPQSLSDEYAAMIQ